MEDNEMIKNIDISKLTTDERRVFVRRMNQYLEYFQHMQKKQKVVLFRIELKKPLTEKTLIGKKKHK